GEEGLSTWAAPVVNEAKDQNLVTDKVLVDFPAPITREEFCELAVLLYEKMTGTAAPAPASNPFSDTTNPQILKAANLGIVGGVGGGKFAPNNNVTRQEISVMLLRTLKNVMPNITTAAEFKTQFQDAGSIDSWALEAVKFMNANDIIGGSTVNGVSYMLPKGNTTREQAIALVLRMYNTFNKL
ncbi:MAG: S-layer homology domain-containing protein, partial [Clostridiaceae bacterium]|nr:S-layer homology domain-containing protein [Clostridiaceae bacterium]